MSFADYGFDIFPYSPHSQSRGNLYLTSNRFREHDPYDLAELDDISNKCYNVIDNLVDFEILRENELSLAKKELEKYRRAHQGNSVLKSSELVDYKREDSEKLIDNTNIDDKSGSFSKDKKNQCVGTLPENSHANSISWRFPGFSFFIKSADKNVDDAEKNIHNPSESQRVSDLQEIKTPDQSSEESRAKISCNKEVDCKILSDETVRMAIIEKDSEIIALKNENGFKESELKELEDHSKRLEVTIGKLKDNIELLENTSRISEAEIEELIRKKNAEVEIARQSSIKMEKELKDIYLAKKHDEREVHHLRSYIQETKACHKGVNEELKVLKRRLESSESSNSSYAAAIKVLQKERDEFEKLSQTQEVEIEKLLKITQRLHAKYEKIKEDFYTAREELLSRERQVDQCRQQLQTTELEVNKLIADLDECLGQVTRGGDSGSESRACNSAPSQSSGDRRRSIYSRAREMTRALDKIVREHIHCHAHRAKLMREISRLRALEGPKHRSRMIQVELSSDGSTEETTSYSMELKGSNNSTDQEIETLQSIEMNMKDMVEEAMDQVEAQEEQRAKDVNIQVEDMTEEEKESIDLSEKCKIYLLQELDNLEKALGEIKKICTDLDSCKTEETEKKSITEVSESEDLSTISEREDHSELNEFSQNLLQRLHNFTRIVIRITSSLKINSAQGGHIKKLESRIEQLLESLQEADNEKSQLKNELDECKKKCKDLRNEILNLETTLSIKSTELTTLTEREHSRFECYQKDVDTLRSQLAASEDKIQENSDLLKKNEEIIENLKNEIKDKEDKIQEFGGINDQQNEKLLESKQMIEYLQKTIIREGELKAEYVNLESLQNHLKDLLKEKENLMQKKGTMEAELRNYEKRTSSMHVNLTKIIDDNEYLEKCIASFKAENERLEKSIANQSQLNVEVGSKFNELLQKIEKIANKSEPVVRSVSAKPASGSPRGMVRSASATTSSCDGMIRGLERDIKCHKEKLKQQQIDLLTKEKEIDEKNKRIEELNNLIASAKEDNLGIDNSAILKRIETLTREKTDLRNELKQTLTKYEDKLLEMHKQYKHTEIELHKNHNESIKRLEAKYADLMREEEKPSNYEAWLESLGPKELHKIYDRVCMFLSKSKSGSIDPSRKKSKVSLSSYPTKKTPNDSKTSLKTVRPPSASRPTSRGRDSVKGHSTNVCFVNTREKPARH